MCEEASLTKPSAAPPVAAIYKTWTLSPISAFNARMVLICPVLERVTFEKCQPICAVLLYIHSRYKETQCQLYVLPKAPCGTATCSFPLLMLALLYNMHSCMPWRIRYTQRSGLALLSSSCPALQQTYSLLAAHAYCALLCTPRYTENHINTAFIILPCTATNLFLACCSCLLCFAVLVSSSHLA
jgi:hypothetical protein